VRFRLTSLGLTLLAAAGVLLCGVIHVINLINPASGWPSFVPRELLAYGLVPMYAFAIVLAWALLKGRRSDFSEGQGSFAASLKDVGWPFWLAIALFGYATIMGLATGDMIATSWKIRPVFPMSARLEAASLLPFYVICFGIFYTCYRVEPTEPADPQSPHPGG
jgi:hypothetical protein